MKATVAMLGDDNVARLRSQFIQYLRVPRSLDQDAAFRAVWRPDRLPDAQRLELDPIRGVGLPGVGEVRSELHLQVHDLQTRTACRRENPFRWFDHLPNRGDVDPGALGIPTIRTRVIQTAALLVLSPIFEADLPDNAWGYRPKRSAVGAVEQVHDYLRAGSTDVVDADLRQYFETIPHAELMRCVARRISDGKLLALIKAWLQAPIVEQDDRGRTRRRGGKPHHRGTPQGGVMTPPTQ